jgi:hypothetical protein
MFARSVVGIKVPLDSSLKDAHSVRWYWFMQHRKRVNVTALFKAKVSSSRFLIVRKIREHDELIQSC